MTAYYRIYLGKQNVFARECYEGGFIGVDFGLNLDLSGRLPSKYKEFNQEFIPILQSLEPGKSKGSAALACGMLWTVSKFLNIDDIVICPTGNNTYYVGKITGDYYHVPDGNLPHRRNVTWLPIEISRDDMSEPLANSARSIATVCDLTKYADEITRLIEPAQGVQIRTSDSSIENPAVFALETYLEDFLITNWASTSFGATHRIYEVDGEQQGRQLRTDTGPLDILAESLDGKELLVLELKKGQASDRVVGQILRYMSWVGEEIASEGQTVRGAIIALDDDLSIRRALSMVNGVDFYRYEVKFSLSKVQ
jgi:restriction system protein